LLLAIRAVLPGSHIAVVDGSPDWALAYMARFGLDVCVPRIFSYSDPRQAVSYFLPATLDRLENAPRNGTLEVRGAHDTRDFLSTKPPCGRHPQDSGARLAPRRRVAGLVGNAGCRAAWPLQPLRAEDSSFLRGLTSASAAALHRVAAMTLTCSSNRLPWGRETAREP
jgi:hypothetical protein